MTSAAIQEKSRSSADTLARVPQAYSDPSWWYNLRGFFILLLAHRTTVWSQVWFLEQSVRSKHLEVPVGNGTLLKFVLWLRSLRRRGPTTIEAVDYSDTMVRAATRSFRRYKNVAIRRGDVANLSFEDAEFESINVANGLHCFPDPDAALSELERVLAPGGVLAASVLLHPRGPRLIRRMSQALYGWGIRKGQLIHPFDLADLRTRVAAHGLTIEEEVISGNTVNFRARKA